LWRDETLRKALAIGEININSESLGALAKGLESAGKRYAENLLFRTIPLNKQFAETLSGLAARCSWVVETFEISSLSGGLREYGIDVGKAKALLCRIQEAAE